MTNEEASERFSVAITATLNREEQDLYRTARKALEKQIPKKPLIVPMEESRIHTFKCPACGSYQVQRRCDDCGQLLDWGAK